MTKQLTPAESIREDTRRFEKQLHELISLFEQQTGAVIEEIDLNRVNISSIENPNHHELFGVHLKVIL